MSNKEDFKSLLRACWLTQTRAAQVISEITLRPLSTRTVRSWLTDPANPSYRPCPDWAIEALREFQRRPMAFEDEEDSPYEPVKPTPIPIEKVPVPRGALPYSFEELDAAFTTAIAESATKKSKQNEFEHFRYRCPNCRIHVWGAQGLILSCLNCDELMREMRD